MQPSYHSLDDLLYMIPAPNGSACHRLLDEHRERFAASFGSTNNHQAWPGGYLDHVTEVLNVAVLLYGALESARPLPFTLGDALLVLFLHDIEKPWKYEFIDDGELEVVPAMRDQSAQHAFRAAKLKEFVITLTPSQENALHYVEGEKGDYSYRRRVMGPLAAFCHLADVTSARVWFDHPLAAADPWSGACRVHSTL